MASDISLILGPPGTGKTTYLLNTLEQILAKTPPSRIGFISFTKKSVQEALDRASIKFNLSAKEFTYFKTIHALAYMLLRVKRGEVISSQHYAKLSEAMGYKITGKQSTDPFAIDTIGDKLLFLENYSRIRSESYEKTFNEGLFDFTYARFEEFFNSYAVYKEHNAILDFTDMLLKLIKLNPKVNIDYLFVDEAQDLNSLQWRIVDNLSEQCKHVFIAGDDDQAIFNWSGADPELFLNHPYTKKIVLPKSYRLPKNIFNLSHQIVSKISGRFEKEFQPSDELGSVKYYGRLDQIDLSEGPWLIIGRTKHCLKGIDTFLEENAWHYSFMGVNSVKELDLKAIRLYVQLQKMNEPKLIGSVAIELKDYFRFKIRNIEINETYLVHDIFEINLHNEWYDALYNIAPIRAYYYRSLIKQGIKLDSIPRISINTIHGVKGGECGNVLLITDLTQRVYENYLKNPCDEHRVFYVGVTRAKETLHILMPQTPMAYNV